MKKFFLSTSILFLFITACNQPVSRTEDTTQTLLTIKLLLFEQERFTDALAEIEKALNNNINDTTLLYLRGMAQLNLKHYNSAMNSFTAAMRLDPENPLPYNGIGNIFYLQYEDILAEKFWSTGLSLAKNPSLRALFLGNMALLLMNEKKHPEAIKLLEEAQNISPDGRYDNLLGRAYLAMNNSRKAQEIWLSALNNTSLPWAQFNFKHNTSFRLAELYYSEKKYKEALKFCEMALLMSPASNEYQRLYVHLKQKNR